MTLEEAIGVLESISAKTDYILITDDARSEALDMAISALHAQDVPDTNVGDMVSRQKAIDALMDEFKRVPTNAIRAKDALEKLPSTQPEYEPVKAEDFAKMMSKNTLYGFMTWHGEALELMERQGFVICKKTL